MGLHDNDLLNDYRTLNLILKHFSSVNVKEKIDLTIKDDKGETIFDKYYKYFDRFSLVILDYCIKNNVNLNLDKKMLDTCTNEDYKRMLNYYFRYHDDNMSHEDLVYFFCSEWENWGDLYYKISFKKDGIYNINKDYCDCMIYLIRKYNKIKDLDRFIELYNNCDEHLHIDSDLELFIDVDLYDPIV